MKHLHHGGHVRNAELIGSDICKAAGFTATSTTPVLTLCRQLLAADLDPDTALAVYRGTTLALNVRSIGEAASLEIAADGVGFRRRRQPDAAPPVEFSTTGRVKVAATAEGRDWAAEVSP